MEKDTKNKLENNSNRKILWLTIINSIFIFLIVYGIQNNNILISFLAYILMTAHICKEYLNSKKWPLWTEYFAILIGLLFIYSGYQIYSIIVMFLGLIIILGHSRQLICDDDIYYSFYKK